MSRLHTEHRDGTLPTRTLTIKVHTQRVFSRRRLEEGEHIWTLLASHLDCEEEHVNLEDRLKPIEDGRDNEYQALQCGADVANNEQEVNAEAKARVDLVLCDEQHPEESVRECVGQRSLKRDGVRRV